jgi:hypothetical protein
MSESNPDALVVLRACGDIHEAYLLRSVLEAADIDAFIPDEYMSPLHPAPVLAAGGVRLLVRAGDFEQARALLESDASNSLDDPGS